jgi:hypothetical protein
MTVFHAENVTAKQACTLFDVALEELLFFAECAKAVTNNHGGKMAGLFLSDRFCARSRHRY